MSTCSSLFITNRFIITVSHHCFLCPEEDESVTVDQFCIGCFTCMPVADNCKGNFVRWLLSISPKLTEGAGQDLWAIFHPLLFGTQEDVCCHLWGLFLCLRAHSMAGASSFGQHPLLQGVLPPWADICLLGCHSSILSSLWNLFGGLSSRDGNRSASKLWSRVHEVFSPFSPLDFRHHFILLKLHSTLLFHFVGSHLSLLSQWPVVQPLQGQEHQLWN